MGRIDVGRRVIRWTEKEEGSIRPNPLRGWGGFSNEFEGTRKWRKLCRPCLASCDWQRHSPIILQRYNNS